MNDKERSEMMRVSPELKKRIQDFQKQINEKHITTASRIFAQTAITPKDKVNDAVKRLGKNWKWQL